MDHGAAASAYGLPTGNSSVAPLHDRYAAPLGGVAQDDRYTVAPTPKFILVIDDSAVVRRITETALRRAGYETRSFQDGIDAMKWLAEPGSKTPDLIFVDIGLPKMDGYEVIRTFKARPRFVDTTCVILSRRDGMVDKLKGRLAGAKAYMTKPFTTQTLLMTVQTHISAEHRYEEVGQ